jgi:hypothetical protein
MARTVCFICAALVVGCATPAHTIRPAPVEPSHFYGYTCGELNRALRYTHIEYQKEAAEIDEHAGRLVLPIGGPDRRRFARRAGEYAALKQALFDRNCLVWGATTAPLDPDNLLLPPIERTVPAKRLDLSDY